MGVSRRMGWGNAGIIQGVRAHASALARRAKTVTCAAMDILNDVAAGLRSAAASFDWLKERDDDIRRWVADKLLHVYNSAWREEEVPLTEDEFVERIEPARVVFAEDGALLLTYDGGEDMFGGQ